MSASLTEERPSKERLSDYFIDLALNPRKLAAHHRDPASALSASALTQCERDLVQSADEGKLYHAINGSEGGPMAPAVTVIVVFVIVHNPTCK